MSKLAKTQAKIDFKPEKKPEKKPEERVERTRVYAERLEEIVKKYGLSFDLFRDTILEQKEYRTAIPSIISILKNNRKNKADLIDEIINRLKKFASLHDLDPSCEKIMEDENAIFRKIIHREKLVETGTRCEAKDGCGQMYGILLDQVQLSASDEANVAFYRCKNCDKTWKKR